MNQCLPMYTYYSLINGARDEAAVPSPGLVDYLLKIELYREDRQLHRKVDQERCKLVGAVRLVSASFFL